MTQNQFVHLHLHSDYSLLDGACDVEKLVERVHELGMPAVAMTDHGIHDTAVIGNQPAVGLALYGYALVRFPSVVWYHPEFESVRALPSRRAPASASVVNA